MNVRLARRLGGLLVLAAASGMVRAQPRETSAPPMVYSADVDSIIHPVSAEFMIQTMDRADREGGRRSVLLRTLDALGIGFDS